MSHAAATIRVHAGDTTVAAVTVTDDGTASGTPVDLTGASEVRFEVARGDGGIALIEKTDIDGIEVTNPSGGIATLTLEPTDTEFLAGIYRYSFTAILSDLSEITVLRGDFLVES